MGPAGDTASGGPGAEAGSDAGSNSTSESGETGPAVATDTESAPGPLSGETDSSSEVSGGSENARSAVEPGELGPPETGPSTVDEASEPVQTEADDRGQGAGDSESPGEPGENGPAEPADTNEADPRAAAGDGPGDPERVQPGDPERDQPAAATDTDPGPGTEPGENGPGSVSDNPGVPADDNAPDAGFASTVTRGAVGGGDTAAGAEPSGKEPADTGPEGRPDISARYPADYIESSAPPPSVDRPHISPESWVGDINPDTDAPGRDINCGECARAVQDAWSGNPSVAAALADTESGGEVVGRMSEWAGTSPEPATMDQIEAKLTELGPGSSAVVGIDYYDGDGHWFNAVNEGGTIKAVDGQSGDVGSWPPSKPNLRFDESQIQTSDAIYFGPDGRTVR